MIFQYQYVPINDLTPLIEFFIHLFLLFLAIYNYKKLRFYELGILIMLIAVIFFLMSISQQILIFSPYIQLLFLMVQLIIFYNVFVNREKR